MKLLLIIGPALVLPLSSCSSSQKAEAPAIIDLYFPTFPSPLDQEGKPVCEYYPKAPEYDQVTTNHLNEIGGYYNPENDRISLPYEELRDCVVVPYDYWLKVLSYSAETEAAAKAYASTVKRVTKGAGNP